ncbi:hypothetical protein [Fluviicola sp.]|uniref:hypothetical protein n=1 Tax=Fluviicola sp. TaxID=1917219 RepID=UPI0031D06D33
MRAYIEQIDIASNGEVIVSGQLSRTNLKVVLSELIYVKPPADGIWGYMLELLPTSAIGADVLVPFSVKANWTGNNQANGLRLTQPALNPQEPDFEIIQLKGKKVSQFTTVQKNMIRLKGAAFDQTTKHLILDLEYGGGCFPHLFSLEWDGNISKSSPPEYHFNLVDLSEHDPCKAIVSIQLRFDMDVPGIQLDVPSVFYIETPSGNKQIRLENRS